MKIKKFNEYINENTATLDDLKEAKFSNNNLNKVSGLLAKIASKRLSANFQYAWTDKFKKSSGESGIGRRYVSPEGLQIRFNNVYGTKNNFAINSVDFWSYKDTLTEPSITLFFSEGVNIVQIVNQTFESIKAGRVIPIKLKNFVNEDIQEGIADKRAEFLTARGLPTKIVGSKRKFLALIADQGLETEWDEYMIMKKNDSEKTEFDTKIRAQEKTFNDPKFYADPKYVFQDMEKATQAIAKRQWASLIILGAPGLGKTYGTKQVLTKQFGPPIDGPSGQWVIKTGESTSMFGIYKTFLTNRDKIIVYDDSDDIWKNDSIIQFLKAATADLKPRVLTYGKGSAANIDMMSPEAAGQYIEDYLDALAEDPNTRMKPPSRFTFTGQFINISNLKGEFFAKGGQEAVASRSIMIDLHLAERDVLRRIATLLALDGETPESIKELLDAMAQNGADAIDGVGRYSPGVLGEIKYITPEEARKNKKLSMRTANISRAFRDAGIKDWHRMAGLYA